jgi:hypothetical protein
MDKEQIVQAILELNYRSTTTTPGFFLDQRRAAFIECAGELVTVITTGSPLGHQILGKKVGDLISAPKAKIESVQ